jgi:hypothetical protein
VRELGKYIKDWRRQDNRFFAAAGGKNVTGEALSKMSIL